MTPEEQALAKGAKFRDAGKGWWICDLMKRGRPLPIARFIAPTKDEAAAMWLNYVKGRK